MLPEELSLVHARVDQEMTRTVARNAGAPVAGILQDVLLYPEELVTSALGHIGKHIRAFAAEADLTHPDLPSLAQGMLSTDSPFSRLATQVLQVADFSQKNNLQELSGWWERIIRHTEGLATVSLRVTDPNKNCSHNARFILDPDKRAELRKKKKSQNISFSSFYSQKKDMWELSCSTFRGYVRNYSPFEDEINRLERRIIHFQEIGLQANCQKVQERISDLKSLANENCYGFNRIHSVEAAIILAKVHGFIMDNNHPSKFPKIMMPTHMVKAAQDAMIFAKTSTTLELRAKRYNVSQLEEVMSDRTRETINFLENFPETANKPAFDHYSVIVCSGTSMLKQEQPATESVEPTSAAKEIDIRLIKEKIAVPILLGERDGKQYFIDYWKA